MSWSHSSPLTQVCGHNLFLGVWRPPEEVTLPQFPVLARLTPSTSAVAGTFWPVCFPKDPWFRRGPLVWTAGRFEESRRCYKFPVCVHPECPFRWHPSPAMSLCPQHQCQHSPIMQAPHLHPPFPNYPYFYSSILGSLVSPSYQVTRWVAPTFSPSLQTERSSYELFFSSQIFFWNTASQICTLSAYANH